MQLLLEVYIRFCRVYRIKRKRSEDSISVIQNAIPILVCVLNHFSQQPICAWIGRTLNRIHVPIWYRIKVILCCLFQLLLLSAGATLLRPRDI